MSKKKKTKKELLQVQIYEFEGEKVVEIETKRLRGFVGHPYKVLDDEAMGLLKDSIQKNGIITPLIVIPTREGSYQIISGHRRKHCAELIGLEKVPVIIRSLPDEDQIISMVDSNL